MDPAAWSRITSSRGEGARRKGARGSVRVQPVPLPCSPPSLLSAPPSFPPPVAAFQQAALGVQAPAPCPLPLPPSTLPPSPCPPAPLAAPLLRLRCGRAGVAILSGSNPLICRNRVVDGLDSGVTALLWALKVGRRARYGPICPPLYPPGMPTM